MFTRLGANKNFLNVAPIFVVILFWYVIPTVNVYTAHMFQLLVYLKINGFNFTKYI